jgi:hypothetical protein
VALVGTPVPESILFSEVVGILGVSAVVVACIVGGNAVAIGRLKARGTTVGTMHWFPAIFAMVLSIESLTFSLTGVYELWLDKLYAPSAPAIVVPIFIMLGYAWRSTTLRELLEVLPAHWLFLPHLTRLSGFSILALVWAGALAPHVGYPVGIGDILCAVLAGPAAWWVATRRGGWFKVMNGFAALAIFDFVLALQLTVWTLPLPIRLLHTELDSTVLAFWPVGVAPTLYVPLLYLTLFSMIIKARQLRPA